MKRETNHQLLLGVLAALGSQAALAQLTADIGKASVTLTGNLAVNFLNIKATGAADPATGLSSATYSDKGARWRVDNVSSDLTAKAEYDAGDGMSVLGQVTSSVNADGGASAWGSAKDVFAGFRMKGVGTLKLGRLTAASRWISGTVDFSPAGAGVQDNQAAWHKTGRGTTTTANEALWGDRMDNAVGFESATWSGFSVRAYYSANEGRSNEKVAAGTLGGMNDSSYSLGAQYVQGPLDVRLSHEVRHDKNTLNAVSLTAVQTSDLQTSDKNTRIGLRYTLPTNTILALGYGKMRFTDESTLSAPVATHKSSLEKTGYVIGVKHSFGKNAVYGGYGRSGNITCSRKNGSACDGSDTNMSNAVLVFQRAINKDTVGELFYATVKNGKRAQYDFDSGGITPLTGASTNAIGMGMRYSF